MKILKVNHHKMEARITKKNKNQNFKLKITPIKKNLIQENLAFKIIKFITNYYKKL